MKPALLRPLVAAVIVGLLSAGRSAAAEPLPVVATLPVLADFVRAVGGDAVTVTSLITGIESEHTYTPKPSDVESVRRAAVLVKVGLGLEVWVHGLIANAENPRLIVVDTSQGIGLMRGGDAHGHADDKEPLPRAEERRSGGNPHVWLDPENAQTMVRHITDGLVRADPGRRKIYLANQAAYLKQLDELTRTLTLQFAAVPDRKIVTHHAAWPYFARRFDLRIRGEIFTQIGSDPSAKRIAELVRLIRKEKIRVIVSEPQLSPKLPEALAEETGARVVILTPLPGALPGTDDYLSMMRYNASALLEALR
jgi:zinc/manganese transport system substrate-binding protein/zinc transport system substrate-binding protein/manganese/iron transport system substrate-binding protein